MRSFLQVAGWLFLIGLFGLGFASTRNRQIAASAPPASSAPDTWRRLVSTNGQALAFLKPDGGVSTADLRRVTASTNAYAGAGIGKPEEHLQKIRLSGRADDAAAAQAAVEVPAAKKLRPESAAKTKPGMVRAEDITQAGTTRVEQPGRKAGQAERLSIPALRVDVQVVEVPFDQFTWDVKGIQQEVAQLGSLPGEPSTRNLVLAGHVTVYNGGHGPFRYLHWLKPGDTLIIETARTIQTYRVRKQIVVKPEDVSIMENTTRQQLTLVTCTDWSEALKIYQRRRVVLADLVKIEPQPESRK